MLRLPLVLLAASTAMTTVTASPLPMDAVIDQIRAQGKSEIEVLTHINAPRHPCPAFLPSLNGRDPSGDIAPASSLDVANHWERNAEHESVAGTVAHIISDALLRRRFANAADVDAYEGMEKLVTKPRWRFGWRG